MKKDLGQWGSELNMLEDLRYKMSLLRPVLDDLIRLSSVEPGLDTIPEVFIERYRNLSNGLDDFLCFTYGQLGGYCCNETRYHLKVYGEYIEYDKNEKK